MSRILFVGRNGAGKTSSIESIKKNSNDNQIVAVQCRAIANYANDSKNEVNKILTGYGRRVCSDTNTAIGRAADRVNSVTTQVEKVIRQYDQLGGFHAIIYVMKYGDSSTTMLEREAVEEVREILGKDVLRKHGIILLTNGEQFDMEHKYTSVTITDWCKQQTGDMGELFREVNYRIVLFNNKTDATSKIIQQINELVKFIRNINHNYGLAEFTMNSKELEGRKVRKLEKGREENEKIKNINKISEQLQNLVDCAADIDTSYDFGDLDMSSSRSKGNTLKILLVGREGNGATSCIKSLKNVSNENELLAVQCRGVADTGDDLGKDIHVVTKDVESVLQKYDHLGGFDAIAHVMKYGVRFNKQEKDAVEEVKRMFGEDVFRRNVIIIMTYGDLFDMDVDVDVEGLAFMRWCRRQTGDIQKLFEEVSYRIVLFDNKTKDTSRLEKQLHELVSRVYSIKMQYGLSEFKTFSQRVKKSRLFTAMKILGRVVCCEVSHWSVKGGDV